jgi:hypothetical protein
MDALDDRRRDEQFSCKKTMVVVDYVGNASGYMTRFDGVVVPDQLAGGTTVVLFKQGLR